MIISLDYVKKAKPVLVSIGYHEPTRKDPKAYWILTYEQHTGGNYCDTLYLTDEEFYAIVSRGFDAQEVL